MSLITCTSKSTPGTSSLASQTLTPYDKLNGWGVGLSIQFIIGGQGLWCTTYTRLPDIKGICHICCDSGPVRDNAPIICLHYPPLLRDLKHLVRPFDLLELHFLYNLAYQLRWGIWPVKFQPFPIEQGWVVQTDDRCI